MPSPSAREAFPEPDPHSQRRFAFFPKKMRNGRWIWLQFYRRERSLYE